MPPSRRRRRVAAGRHVARSQPWWRITAHPVRAMFVLVALFAGGLLLASLLHRPAAPPAVRRAVEPVAGRSALAAVAPGSRPTMPPKPVEHAALSPAVPPSAPPAWRRFAVPAPPAAGRPLVAVVIDDLGLDRRRTAEVLGLPGPLTLSFMTYAQGLAAQTAAGHRAGDELLLHVPMQPLDPRENPGPRALTVAMSPEEIRAQLDWGLDRFAGFVGINNHMGSRFTADARGMAAVMAELRRRGLLFLDSKTTAASAGSREAAAAGVPYAARDVFLDDVLSRPAIDRQLALVEQVARRTGSAIAIGHGHDPTIAALRAWLPALPRKGLVLVPLSAVVRYRLRTEAVAGR